MQTNKKTLQNSLLACLVLFSFLGCDKTTSILDRAKYMGLAKSGEFDRPTVIFATPLTDERNVKITNNITITFSQPMDKAATESGMTINSNGGLSNTRIAWKSDFQLEIVFKTGLTAGKRYEVRFNKNIVKDVRGNYMSENYLTYFYTIGADVLPFVMSSEPEYTGSIVLNYPINKNIKITFSDAMDQAKTNSAISISGGPAVFVKSWDSSSKVVTLNLLQSLEKSTQYTLKVASSAQNQAGLTIGSDYSVLFNTGSNTVLPDVAITSFPSLATWPGALVASPSLNTATQISKSDSFRFTFTKAMDPTTTISAITFSPAITGQFEWKSSTVLEFTPAAKLTQNATYRMTIADSALDTSNLPLVNSYVVDMVINNPNDTGNISIVSITGYGVSGVGCIRTADTPNPFATLPIDISKLYQINLINDTNCASRDYEFEIVFQAPGGCLMTTGAGDIYSQISVSYFAGPNSSPSIFYKEYNPTVNCIGNQTYKIGIKSLNTTTPKTQYTFLLKGGSSGLLDAAGNYLLSDTTFTFEGSGP